MKKKQENKWKREEAYKNVTVDVANNLEVKDHEEVKTRVAKRARMKNSSKNKEGKFSQET